MISTLQITIFVSLQGSYFTSSDGLPTIVQRALVNGKQIPKAKQVIDIVSKKMLFDLTRFYIILVAAATKK